MNAKRHDRSTPARLARVTITMAFGPLLLLGGCAAFSPDGGMGAVREIAGSALEKDVASLRTAHDAADAHSTVGRLLKRPLSPDAAVQIALLNNRGLQAAYDELAAADARRVGESVPPNPRISLMRISSSAELEVEKRIVADVLALASLPVRSDIAAARFRQVQLRAAEETLRLAARARRAYYRAVAARELTGFLTQAQGAAETATKLAARLGETGGMNKLDQAREQVFYAELTAQLASARQRATSERESLARSLGLWGGDLDFKLPGTLPSLPRRPYVLPGIESEAVRRRVDLQIARMELDALARSYGLTQATRFINLLDAGYAGKTIEDHLRGETIRDRGFDLELQVPLFDFGEARVREAEATYMQALNRLIERAVNVRSEAREAYQTYRSTYDIAAHYRREVLPLRKIISDETLLRYNAMQIDVFSLLAEARQRITATVAAIDAEREFWLAMTDLGVAVTGGDVAAAKVDETRTSAGSSGGDGGQSQ